MWSSASGSRKTRWNRQCNTECHGTEFEGSDFVLFAFYGQKLEGGKHDQWDQTQCRQTHLHGVRSGAAGAGVLHGERTMPRMPLPRPREHLLASGWHLSADRYGENREETEE